MPVLLPSDFTTMPWKNGGGITHEIARAEADGRLLWRLSIAEVTSDGPFSAFPGLMRILTIISGAGLILRTPEGVIVADPMQPARFSGDLPVTASRIAGDVRDLNAIFDPTRTSAAVTRAAGPAEIARDDAQTVLFLCLRGQAVADGVPVPSGAVARDFATLVLPEETDGLMVRIGTV